MSFVGHVGHILGAVVLFCIAALCLGGATLVQLRARASFPRALDESLVACESGGSWSKEGVDARYPGWHRWIPVHIQEAICVWIYASVAIWVLIYLTTRVFSWEGTVSSTLVACFMVASPVLASVLLLGMVSKVPEEPAIFACVAVSLCVAVLALWPLTLLPLLAGLLTPFGLYVALLVVDEFGVVYWPSMGLPAYMTIAGPALALLNALQFEMWCCGYLPKLVYLLWLPLVESLGTSYRAVHSREEDFDYQVKRDVFGRLASFRLGLLLVFSGGCLAIQGRVQVYFQQELRMDPWQCTPLSW